MKNTKKIFSSVLTLIILIALIYGCRNPLEGKKGYADISITLRMPDYTNHSFPGARTIQAASIGKSPVTPKVVDPATFSVEVTVSAPDMITLTRTFSFAEAGSYSSGAGEVVCNVQNVPVGLSRQFEVVTKDTDGTVLTQGTTVSDVFMWAGNHISLTLLPADAAMLTLGVPVNGSVAYGRMKYYSITLEDPGLYSAFLSSGQDTDIYLFNSDGSLYSNEFQKTGAPTWERTLMNTSESDIAYFIGVFGNTEGTTNEYSIISSKIMISFTSARDGNVNIYSMDTDGSNQTRLTDNPADDYNGGWSSNGTKLAFASNRTGDWEIYVMDTNGSNPIKLTSIVGVDQAPRWSPENTRIVFHSNRDGNFEIYIMKPDGSDQIRLTNNTANDINCGWSPDGTKIVFQSYRDGNGELYVMNTDGSSQTRLTSNAADDGQPDWSPDGSRITFYSNRDGNKEIYSMNADGSNQTRLTNEPTDDWGPNWSPDGTKLAFFSG
ncbi:MAG: DUF5050 domain-containing protein, partial [Spirochaetota bacterium]